MLKYLYQYHANFINITEQVYNFLHVFHHNKNNKPASSGMNNVQIGGLDVQFDFFFFFLPKGQW